MACHSVEGGAEHPARAAVLADFVDQYVAYGRRVRNQAEETVAERRLYLGRFFAAQSAASPAELFASLTATSIRRFIFEYAECHGPGSRRWMQATLRSFLRFCHYRRYLPCDLSSAVPASRSWRLSSVPKAIDDGTVSALLESLGGGSPTAVRDLAIVELLVTYGVRGIQVRHLRLDDIEWADNRIRFQAVKGGRPVVQHLTPRVGNSLLAYIQGVRPRAAAHAQVFLTLRPPFHPIGSSGSFASIISRRLRRIGAQLPKGVSHGAHSFRHAFASRLVGQVPLKYIADMLGHRDLTSTYLYSKVNFTALRETALPWPEEVKP
jgi:integrase/recombinase XerD